ncbi:MAG: hypothetical protein ACTHL8_09935 [Burkholderiaceae bacterium]
MNAERTVEVGALVVGLGVAAWLVWKLDPGGIFSGNNALTENATDASGQKTTAYQGAGVVGTLGAAVNKATGGTTASVGQSIGSTLYDWLNPDPNAQANAALAAAQTAYQQSPAAGTTDDGGGVYLGSPGKW